MPILRSPRTLLTTLRYAFKRNRAKFTRGEVTNKWALAAAEVVFG